MRRSSCKLFCIKLLLFISLSSVITGFAGCLNRPYMPAKDAAGSLTLFFTVREARINCEVDKAFADDLEKLYIKLEHEREKIIKEKTIAFGGCAETSFTHLYPGLWNISVSGTDVEGDTIFYGNENLIIESGTSCNKTIYLTAAPGILNVTLDASGIPGFGSEITTGKLYVYYDPESGSSTSYILKAEDLYLTGEIEIPEGTYQAKVAVPQTTDAVYESPVYTVNIRAGKVTELSIYPDGSVNISGIIDSTPATPVNLTVTSVTYDEINDKYCVALTWQEVDEPDLAGYRVYRSNKDGRYLLISELTVTNSYNDTVSKNEFYNNKIGYAVSSFDRAGNESLWSSPVYVYE